MSSRDVFLQRVSPCFANKGNREGATFSSRHEMIHDGVGDDENADKGDCGVFNGNGHKNDSAAADSSCLSPTSSFSPASSRLSC